MINKQQLKRYISNLPGWRTDRKIVVIESDDWGSIYMPTVHAKMGLINSGLNLNTHYLQYDSLETRADLQSLFKVLKKHKDSTNRPPVITAVANVANPDFNAIKESNFTTYSHESFVETSNRFEASSGILEDYKEGIQNRLFYPIFHGREHLNITRWMKLLSENNFAIKTAFKFGVPALGRDENGKQLPDLRAAFDLDDLSELEVQKEVLKSGLALFEEIFGFKSRYMVPPNGPFNSSLEENLKELGVEFIGTSKIHLSPLGGGKWKKEYRYLGKKNKHQQAYITRNCFFEPSSWEHSKEKDWVSSCTEEISSAFLMKKPATISSHRVNYMGGLDLNNRENGLERLDTLLGAIIKRWPSVEFLTAEELGDIIAKSEK